jgi:hypothetical protein
MEVIVMNDIVSPLVTTILGNFEQVVSKYESNFVEIGRLDNETQDLLHEIELSPAKDMYKGYKLYRELKIARERRRQLKDENLQLEEMYGYCKNPNNVCDTLNKMRDKAKAKMEHQAARRYVAKVRTDLSISQVIKPVATGEIAGTKLHKMIKDYKTGVKAKTAHKYL